MEDVHLVGTIGKNLNMTKRKNGKPEFKKKEKKQVWCLSRFSVCGPKHQDVASVSKVDKRHQSCYNHIDSKGHDHVTAAGVWIPFRHFQEEENKFSFAISGYGKA